MTQAADAALIAADSFLRGESTTSAGNPANGEYDIRTSPTNANLIRRADANGAGQNPTVPGFGGAWTGNSTSASNAVAQWSAQFGGISSDNLIHPAGGRARFDGVDNLQRRVQRSLSAYTPSSTYYMSFISQVLTTAETNLDGFVGMGFTNSGADANFNNGSTTMRGLLIGAAGNGTTTDYVVRHRGAAGVVNSVILPSITQNDELGSPFVRFTVVKLEFNDDPGNIAGNSKITIWQDPTDLNSEAATTAAASPLVFRTFALGTNADLAQLTMLGLDYSLASSFDEPRLGTEWTDVAPVPEPTSLSLLALGGLALLRRRRRRC